MIRRLMTLSAAVLAVAALAPAEGTAASFAFQPIGVQRINLPGSVRSAGWPVFAHDGRHLLFFSTGANTKGGSTGPGAAAELWITGLTGHQAHCLTCGVANDPTSRGEGEITPFADGKRVFFGSFNQPGSSHYGVLECSPSVVSCTTARILPVDFSAAEPAAIPPGGAVSKAQGNLGGAYGAKLAQDDVHIGFSDIRTDSIETMVVGTLTRAGTTYKVTDPRVINPPAPTSTFDTNLTAWSNGGALYEFKTFTHGGADATYVESGGSALLNPDVWSVNLKTGKRTRLTGGADYDEDNAISPNGQLLALWSNRTMHITDWFGGLPRVRDFIDTPAALMSLGISSSNKRCHGPIWVLPSSGDQNGRLVGEPIVDYRVRHVFVTNNLTGWPQWSPNGTMLALNTTNNSAGPGYPAHAPFLLVAHFTALTATRPLNAVSSQPGSWAVTPTAYHPTMGFIGTRTFSGRHGGTAVVTYDGGSVLSGHWSETYTNYTDDGTSFINGTVSIDATGAGVGTYTANLTMTGAHTGSDHISYNTTTGGHGTSTLDGHTVRGPSPEQAAKGACPTIQPKKPKLHLKVQRRAAGTYRITVTSRVAGAGANEASTETAPVYQAKVQIGTTTVLTDRRGIAVLRLRHGARVTVTAGDTLQPAAIRLSLGRR